MPPLTPDQLAAHSLLSELRTRIAVQPLPYQYGIEARALESLWEVFGLARRAMKDYPGCKEFAHVTTDMLNTDLRPLTAKWHRAHQSGVLDSKDGANDFRIDLAAVQIRLMGFTRALHLMAYNCDAADQITPPVISEEEINHCFEPVQFGINETATSGIANATAINEAEARDITSRREFHLIKTPARTDAVGLALSGGGIRSATFCLGVVQVLADKGLMKDFDYLSTVSGGGYVGSFITSGGGSEKSFGEIGNPYGPDTNSVRHVRQNAKYLSAVDLKQRWLMVTGTVAGLLLNWTAPLSFLATLALLSNYLASYFPVEMWLSAASLLGSITVVLVLLYGVALRLGAGARVGSIIFAWGAGLTVLALAGFAIEMGYALFAEMLVQHWTISVLTAALVISVPAILRFLPLFGTPSAKRIVLKCSIIAAGFITPLLALAAFYLLRVLGSVPTNSTGSLWDPLTHISGTHALIFLAAFCGLFAGFLLNINLTGLHKLYRDQLAKTFINGADTQDHPLSEVNPLHRSPYHLLNATVNLPASANRVLRDRRADFFVFSKHWSGAPAIGYMPTTEWRSNGVPIDLATAMAISGAATSPHMGQNSLPSLSALLTVLNVRLGYWIANPTSNRKGAPGFMCLLREMTGIGMSETKPWLNLSDGGHIENMGIYELLRRRCKFIVCVDGEADPTSTFEGQLTLVRHAQIDFGVRLEPRLDDVRLNPQSSYSRTHSHLFRIHYPSQAGMPEEVGLMLYLKLSLTGDETELLKRYRTLHPEFPHQSTIDQFYDEEQFEVYRQLGVHVAEGAFSPALLTKNAAPQNVAAWFRQLASNMLEPMRT